MKEIVNTLFFLAAAAAISPQSAAFQPVRVSSRPLRQAQSVYSSPPDTIETNSAVSQDVLGLEPQQEPQQQDMFSLTQDIGGRGVYNEKIAGLIAASAIVGGFALTHADSAVYQSTIHTLQHVAQAWGSQAWKSYEAVLASNPISTKAATSATVYCIGDIIAQKSQDGDDGLDFARIARSGLAGGIGHGPLSHLWYNLSEDFFNN
ncbi:MAG: hypothetical protein SGBAC_011108, partial [Bacillariaceae sp.]